MKTIRQHWESLPNRKLGEWLMKQPLVEGVNLDFEAYNIWSALFHLEWVDNKYGQILIACYNIKSWQPLLDALPELRDEPYTYIDPQNDPLGTPVRVPHVSVQPQQDRIEQLETEIRKLRTEAAIKEGKEINQRRAEVVQLVAAMIPIQLPIDPMDIKYSVAAAIAIQAEIDKQLNGKDRSKSCTCVESSPGETWCCNLCGLPKDDRQLK